MKANEDDAADPMDQRIMGMTRKEISQRLNELQAEVVRKIDLPTDYEIRRDALMAAATVLSSGGWTDTASKAREFTTLFERYLRGEGW